MFSSLLFSLLALTHVDSLTFHFKNETICFQIDMHTNKITHGVKERVIDCNGKILDILIANEYFENREKLPLICPDNAIEFVSFCPNNNQLEINVTQQVHDAAVNASLNSILLLVENATKANFLNYSSCPNLVGLFYDGDADNSLITVYNDVVHYSDIQRLTWRYNVTSYWLACEAYNPPMLDAMISVQPRRWAAGRNNLFVGTSDYAAAAAMIAAINGSCLEESFDNAVKQLDQTADNWGYGGFGPNILLDNDTFLPCGGNEAVGKVITKRKYFRSNKY